MSNFTVRLLTLTLLAGLAQASVASDMTYFGGEINYWGEARDQRGMPGSLAEAKPPDATGAFDWQRYSDPQSDDFFREGEYLPPAPFMEVARDPSDDNLRHWFAYIGAKNAVMKRLEERMGEFGGSEGRAQPVATTERRAQGAPATQTLETKRYVLRFYFESTCPHCQRMAPEIDKLRRLGFAVEARQVDVAPANGFGRLSTRAVRADKDELQRYAVQSVPMLLIADLQTRAVYRLSGYQSAEQILTSLQTKF